ncbi:hypothetical protein V511_01065 [Mesotoga sp. Brook.08.YT.4.2.5.1]|nr:hypothetical protein V511_01065 [Mesotoga sp. Brook.08.YT.4.2.5.1]RAO97238.1 hypothetical protein M388_11410 [Mesotoga sp. Brook.08.YT.4.2.5.4.]RDI91545.1 hypothetical protein Q502_11085 [Mesotoga sp. Brook.08.YT.4.2.5.2.]
MSSPAPKIRCALKNLNPLIAVKYGSPLTVQDHGPVHRKGRCTLKSGEPADRCEIKFPHQLFVANGFWSSERSALSEKRFFPHEAGLGSPDASPGIATWAVLAQPCV